MANNRIEFEMTLKELTFKYKGDSEQGHKLQSGINRTLVELSRLQAARAAQRHRFSKHNRP